MGVRLIQVSLLCISILSKSFSPIFYDSHSLIIDKLYMSLAANTIIAKLSDQFHRASKIFDWKATLHLNCDEDYPHPNDPTLWPIF